jgi:hypothetical protein
MAAVTEIESVARDYVELVDLLRARKDELGLSNEFLEAQCLMAAGSCTKYLGRAPIKNLTGSKLGDILAVLACQLRLEPDPDQEERMQGRWERRDAGKVHAPKRRVSKARFEVARPLVHEAMARAGGEARARMLTSTQRSESARTAALARWRLHRAAAKARAAARPA